MATKKKTKKKRTKSKRTAGKTVAPMKKTAKRKLAKKTVTPKKKLKTKVGGKKTTGGKTAGTFKKKVWGESGNVGTVAFAPEGLGERAGGQSGGFQGLSNSQRAGSRSVDELLG